MEICVLVKEGVSWSRSLVICIVNVVLVTLDSIVTNLMLVTWIRASVGTAQTSLLVTVKHSTVHVKLATLENDVILILMNVTYLKTKMFAKMVDFVMMPLMPMFVSVVMAFMVTSVNLYQTCVIILNHVKIMRTVAELVFSKNPMFVIVLLDFMVEIVH
jgi:hypothetical protein